MRVLTISWDNGLDITKITYNQGFSASDWIVRADVLEDAIGMLTDKYDAIFTEKGMSGYGKTIEDLRAEAGQDNLTPRQGLEEYKKGYAQAELKLKREPLSDERLRDLSNSINDYPDFGNVSVWQAFYIARLIEKEHDIGGGE